MKANELMIGDWVLYNETHQQILEISGIDDEVYLETDELVHQSEIQPIPLTPEILEKNGFKRDPLWHHCDKDLDDYSISVQLGYANRIEYIKIAEKGKDNVVPSEKTRLYLTHIKYVHELQHIMRLLGFKKEIVL